MVQNFDKTNFKIQYLIKIIATHFSKLNWIYIKLIFLPQIKQISVLSNQNFIKKNSI